jgi:hypothetical protein
MLLVPRQESRFRRLEPTKNKRGRKEKFEMEFEIYLESLVLVRHLKIEA